MASGYQRLLGLPKIESSTAFLEWNSMECKYQGWRIIDGHKVSGYFDDDGNLFPYGIYDVDGESMQVDFYGRTLKKYGVKSDSDGLPLILSLPCMLVGAIAGLVITGPLLFGVIKEAIKEKKRRRKEGANYFSNYTPTNSSNQSQINEKYVQSLLETKKEEYIYTKKEGNHLVYKDDIPHRKLSRKEEKETLLITEEVLERFKNDETLLYGIAVENAEFVRMELKKDYYRGTELFEKQTIKGVNRFVQENYLRGYVYNNRLNGPCEIKYKNGILYQGSVINGKWLGVGTITFPDGGMYSGSFLKNEMRGYGEFSLPNLGEFNVKAGLGLLIYFKDRLPLAITRTKIKKDLVSANETNVYQCHFNRTDRFFDKNLDEVFEFFGVCKTTFPFSFIKKGHGILTLPDGSFYYGYFDEGFPCDSDGLFRTNGFSLISSFYYGCPFNNYNKIPSYFCASFEDGMIAEGETMWGNIYSSKTQVYLIKNSNYFVYDFAANIGFFRNGETLIFFDGYVLKEDKNNINCVQYDNDNKIIYEGKMTFKIENIIKSELYDPFEVILSNTKLKDISKEIVLKKHG